MQNLDLEFKFRFKIQISHFQSQFKFKQLSKVITSNFRIVIVHGPRIIKTWGVTTEHWPLATEKMFSHQKIDNVVF